LEPNELELIMRKIIIASLIAAACIPGAAAAQSRGEIRNDREEVREERRDLRDARRYGDREDVREERREYRDARRELREDQADRRQSRYVAPYRDWRYSRVNVGYQLRPVFYSNRYYISDYARRGLRQPGRNQQWIRYGDDLLLVNVRNGRVLQTIYNRF
jgi:Ni/Co efflux regulator RcnB